MVVNAPLSEHRKFLVKLFECREIYKEQLLKIDFSFIRILILK